MSFADHIILWLHITAAVFTIGPGTAAIMATPRYIRKQNAVVVGYLYRTTRIYTFAALLTLAFGLIITAQLNKFSQWWISTSLTLFVVAFVFLMLILRNQRKALAALTSAGETSRASAGDTTRSGETGQGSEGQSAADSGPAPTTAPDPKLAAVERGQIASLGGITSLIWLVILVLMVWNGS